MPEIVLTTLNAKYVHCAFGLRYLMANLGELRSRAKILEFDIHQQPADIAETILREKPKIVGIGVYIWNATPCTQLVAHLKRLQPQTIVVIGGPEVSHETEAQQIAQLSDYVISGEADFAFAELCRELLLSKPCAVSNGGVADGAKSASFVHRRQDPAPSQVGGYVIRAAPPDFNKLILPYDLYTDEDITHRIIYVEASRGCPFECEFCLSSLDTAVRTVLLEKFLAAMQTLLDRGVRRFKFVDRTFNLDIQTSGTILRFFLERLRPGLLVHFEMIPDRFPQPLRELICQFPQGVLQFEVGVQTFNEKVAALISRRQDNVKVQDNLRWLREQTGVHIHADLIAGLPGEDIESFGAGFDRLIALRPHIIQIELLKRLRGAPIARHDREWQMVYNPHPPYEVLQTKLIDFFTMQRLRRFARYWDLVGNSGNFVETTPLIWGDSSPFAGFMRFSDWLYLHAGRTHAISLPRLSEMLFKYLTRELQKPTERVLQLMRSDYQRGGRGDLPGFLRDRHVPQDG